MTKTATIIGKGPSAEHATEFIAASPGCTVVAINDAGRAFEQPIDYCFFTDHELIARAEPYWERTHTFVCPHELHVRSTRRKGATWKDVLTKPDAHVIEIPYDVKHKPSEEYIRERLTTGRIVHQSTSIFAHTWLISQGYRHIRLIGIDGVPDANHCYSRWRLTTQLIDRLSKELLGVETEWWKESQ